MEEGTRRSSPQLEDIPDLIHRIQSLLPVKEAARTSILSKSWLHAWSTIPTLRFREASSWFVSKEQRTEFMEVVNRTIIRYLRDNIPIQSIDINVNIENPEAVSFAEKWIGEIAGKSSLQELSMAIWCVTKPSFMLPEEILSGKALSKISVCSQTMSCIRMASHPVINCLSLRELLLLQVHIKDDVLDRIFSTCRLLVKIHILSCKGYNTIKIKNLHGLYELGIDSKYVKHRNTVLEISDVPNIRSISFDDMPLPFNLDSLRNVTKLRLGGVIIDDAIVHIIESKFPLLESLTLHLQEYWKLESFNFTSDSIKRISIWLNEYRPVINIKVNAPNLVFFGFHGMTMPTLLFPATNILEKMDLYLQLMRPFINNESFFVNMREALMFPRKCDIVIHITRINDIMSSDMINIDGLRRRFPFPAINVQRLSFKTINDYKGLGERSPFFDALFTICHPQHVIAYRDSDSDHNYVSQLMVREVMEKKTRKGYWRDYLKDVEIRRHDDEKWEFLTSYWRRFLEGPAGVHCVEFKLNWC